MESDSCLYMFIFCIFCVFSLPDEPSSPDKLYISTVRGDGLSELVTLIESTVIESTGRLRKTLKIPMNGEHLR